jgi:hypothetical protein
MNVRKLNMKYGRLVVFIRHDSAEIWRFRYGLTRVKRTKQTERKAITVVDLIRLNT